MKQKVGPQLSFCFESVGDKGREVTYLTKGLYQARMTLKGRIIEREGNHYLIHFYKRGEKCISSKSWIDTSSDRLTIL